MGVGLRVWRDEWDGFSCCMCGLRLIDGDFAGWVNVCVLPSCDKIFGCIELGKIFSIFRISAREKCQ
jgi:hypothetical protein